MGQVYSDRPWFQSLARDEKTALTPLYQSLLTGDQCFTIAAAVVDLDGVMSKSDFEAFLDDQTLPAQVRQAAQTVLDDSAHPSEQGILLRGRLAGSLVQFVGVHAASHRIPQRRFPPEGYPAGGIIWGGLVSSVPVEGDRASEEGVDAALVLGGAGLVAASGADPSADLVDDSELQ